MGHDHHFLSRLDRVSHDQTELALNLYRDHELVEYLVQRAGAGPKQRFAVAIGPADVGPYLILQGNGHFITCLAAGMSPGTHRVFPRVWLDEMTRSYGALRVRLARIKRASREEREDGLIAEILRRGMVFPREDFLAARALAPLLGRALLGAQSITMNALVEGQTLFTHKLRSGPALDTFIERTWRAYWSSSTMALLLSQTGETGASDLMNLLDSGVSISGVLTGSGAVAITLRGIHLAANIGPRAIPAYLQRLESPDRDLPSVARDAVLSLLAIGSKYPAVWSEVLACFRGLHSESKSPIEAYRAALVAPFLGEKAPEEVLREAELGLVSHARLAPVARANRSAEAHVTDERARLSAAFLLDDDTTERGLALVLGGLRHFATCDTSELFMPESVAVHAPRLSPREKLQILRRRGSATYGVRAAVVPAAGAFVGRKTPCPCGSGRKTKRCCNGASPT